MTVASAAAATVPSPAMASAAPAPTPHGRVIVVAIDPGHGGRDPGAHGPHGALEKNATLAIARKLAALVDQQPGMKAVLTRDSDVLVPLRERFQKARHAHADLFISIHCDASRDRSADGATVYVLSDHGASSEHAKALADRENYEELVGGVDLSDEPPQVRSVLVDMSQSAAMSDSFEVGASVARQLAAIGAMHRNAVQQAGFMVLKAPDVPSMLIETNYITNPRAAKLLMNPDYQEQLAQAIATGVSHYFDRYPPPGTVLALNRTGHEGAAMMAGGAGLSVAGAVPRR
ncbi:MAG TPA: N-acetylmuramoyl-L-alanine amidase, partial [Gammaproteobacteria bacterium]|nr:N-acetylmuramoyl-L-alanine amidase [Gammaproteobacteria bacterium]